MPDNFEMRGKYHAVDKQNPHDLYSDNPKRHVRNTSYHSDTPYPPSDHSSDVESLDELDPLHDGRSSSKRRKARTESQIGAGASEDSAFISKLRGGADGESGIIPLRHQILRRPWMNRIFNKNRMFCWLVLLFVVVLLLLLSVGGIWAWTSSPVSGKSPPWYPSPHGGNDPAWADAYSKAAELVRQMALVEKVNITTGIGWAMGLCVGNTGPVMRLGFPSLCLQDGPLGMRFVDNATAWPAGITVGATWSKELMYKRGRAHGEEAHLKGVNVLLAPAMGPFGRLPAGGRNWEGFGSDPVLQGTGAMWTIKGIQDAGVIATAKHYVGNEQEHFRQSFEWGTPNAISSNIDDRTLHEIYAWPFADSVRAGVGSVMCSYNQVNNSYACQNSRLLNGILKDELGFQGFIQSDWLAQRSGVASALAGLDMSMPGDGLHWQDGKPLWGPELTKAVLNSSVPVDRLNDMVTRIVATWYQLGQDDKQKWPLAAPEGDGTPNFSSWSDEAEGRLHQGSDDKTRAVVNKFVNAMGDPAAENSHARLARRIAAEGTVMVKNENNTLPITREGISQASGFTHHKDDFKVRIGIYGEDARANPKGPNACQDRGCNEGTLGSGWGSGAVDFPWLITPYEALRREFNNDSVIIHDFMTNEIPTTKLHFLEQQDMCLVFINSDAGEGFLSWEDVKGDRNDLYSQKGGDELIKSVSAHCGPDGKSPVIVVVHAVGPVIVENWIDLPNVKSVLLAHLPGQESGNAIADILFGDENPSGRLPYTIARAEEDYGPDSRVMYYPNGVVPQQNFTEGLYVDYRHFDAAQVTPRYEFGYGLSYSEFSINDLVITVDVSKKSMLPAPRPNITSPLPPHYKEDIPSPSEAVWPPDFRRPLRKYIYPYISSATAPGVSKGRYPYPDGYSKKPHEGSPAGGGPGGNPDLYSIVANVSFVVRNESPDRAGWAVPQVYVSYPTGWVDPDRTAPLSKSKSKSKSKPTPAQTGKGHLGDARPLVSASVSTLPPAVSTPALSPPTTPSSSSAHPKPTFPPHTPARPPDFPVRALRGFDKVFLQPRGQKGDAATVVIGLTRRDLSFWDTRRQNWVMPTLQGRDGLDDTHQGEFGVWVGWSSRDLRISGVV
ncbi:beta-glucosidase 1 precursor [Phyllosticta citriasiana]|uniref:beta-glucosidase 1 precursor n=1 Tax=Phyllosticta citriasiana TaxID=595635 RepID=UPI0030FD7860